MTTTSSPGIRLSGLRKTYGPVTAVDGIDLDVAPGEVVALLGPNGAGKSTTIDLLLGLSRPDGGSVTVFGGSPRQACVAGRVGAMLQTGTLPIDFTVREIVEAIRVLSPNPLASTRCCGAPGSPTSPGSGRRSCPADSGSGCASRWRSPPTPTW